MVRHNILVFCPCLVWGRILLVAFASCRCRGEVRSELLCQGFILAIMACTCLYCIELTTTDH